MDWLSQRPEFIVDRAEPGDLLPGLRAASELSTDAQKKLDYALRQWTLYALSRSADLEGVLELDDLAAVALRLLPESTDTAVLRTRWRAFRDLLESKRLAIGSAQSGRAHKLLHASPILELLGAGPKSQTTLRHELRLSAARLSQVLGVMEEGGLIQRQKRGKENMVSVVSTTNRGINSPRSGVPVGRLGVCVFFGLSKAA
ncbi:MAG: ArsR family transcriptional regulator [Betaproteobacteria bacterium]|nr:ArsR family transcriptional regulator [Betaproteobacteria bacterium]